MTRSPARAGDLGLVRIVGRHAPAAERGEAEKLGDDRHRVGGELPAARAGARARASLRDRTARRRSSVRRRARQPPRTRPESSRRGPESCPAQSIRRTAPGPGMLSRASAIDAAGIVLSQPTRMMRPSKPLPRVTSSIESAITSRLTSEAFIPSVPIVMPSEIETVLNSIGVPPARRMPSFTCTARSRR